MRVRGGGGAQQQRKQVASVTPATDTAQTAATARALHCCHRHVGCGADRGGGGATLSCCPSSAETAPHCPRRVFLLMFTTSKMSNPSFQLIYITPTVSLVAHPRSRQRPRKSRTTYQTIGKLFLLLFVGSEQQQETLQRQHCATPDL